MSGRSTVAYLGLGSNMGARLAHLDAAIASLESLPGTAVLRRSPIYESEPWGPVRQDNFLNLVVEVSTALEPHGLLRECKLIEREQGREAGTRWGPRPVDLDILLYGSRVVDTPDLQIPHPRMWERAFVLRPLADLRPDLHDAAGLPIIGLLEKPAISSQGVRPFERRAPGNE